MPKTILVRLVDNVGDIIIGLPIIRNLKAHFHSSQLITMVKPEHRVMLRGYSDAHIPPRPVSGLKALVGKYDLVINIAYAFPEGYRSRAFRRNRINHIGIKDWNNGRHVYSNLLDGVASHGIPVHYHPPRLRLSPDAERQARAWLDANIPDIDRHLLVAVNAGSGFKHKRWPSDRFTRVCKWLIAEFDAKIIVVSQNRRDYAARQLYHTLPQYGRRWLVNTPLDTVAAILKRTDLCIGNDSGIGHLAAAVKTPTVTIFGPTSPRLWKPIGPRNIVVFHRENTCCCGYDQARICKNKVCFTKITERNFADAILHCLNEHVGRDTKSCLDRITVADSIVMSRNHDGTILTNTKSPHPLRINSGLPEVRRFLNLIRNVQSYSRIVEYDSRHRPLLHFLLLHRILVSTSTAQYNRWL